MFQLALPFYGTPDLCLSVPETLKKIFFSTSIHYTHSLIRGVLIQSCSAGAKNFTIYIYVFCHPQFHGVNCYPYIENRCAIKARPKKNQFLLYNIDYFDNN